MLRWGQLHVGTEGVILRSRHTGYTRVAAAPDAVRGERGPTSRDLLGPLLARGRDWPVTCGHTSGKNTVVSHTAYLRGSLPDNEVSAARFRTRLSIAQGFSDR